MCCKSLWIKTVPFVIALSLGIFVAGLFQKNNYRYGNKAVLKSGEIKFSSGNGSGSGIGSGYGGGGGVEVKTVSPANGTNKVQVISKPRAYYTDAARQNGVMGEVNLRVTFLASGQIGDVSPINELPDGLTEEAIKAAKQIRFQPATVEGKPVTVVKTVKYSFVLY